MTCTVLFQTVKVTGAEFKNGLLKCIHKLKACMPMILPRRQREQKIGLLLNVNAVISAWNHICLFAWTAWCNSDVSTFCLLVILVDIGFCWLFCFSSTTFFGIWALHGFIEFIYSFLPLTFPIAQNIDFLYSFPQKPIIWVRRRQTGLKNHANLGQIALDIMGVEFTPPLAGGAM